MKLAIITDTHYGKSDQIRDSQDLYLDNIKQFLNGVFFPTLEEQNIKFVIHLGDMVDKRKTLNFYTAHRLYNDFIKPLNDREINLNWILGNHDIYWRNTNDVNVSNYIPGNFEVHDQPQEMVFWLNGGEEVTPKILFVPWICDSNREQTQELINKTDARICFGHLELKGFERNKGDISPDGEDPNIYKKFDLVCSGHYHHKSLHDNIHYLGASSEFTWSDYNDPRGFHIFDSVLGTLDFIQNPYTIYKKLFYDDTKQNGNSKIDFGSIKGKIIKVIVKSRTDSDRYNEFMIQCEKAQPFDLSVVDDHLNLDLVNNETIVNEVEDTLTIIRNHIASANAKVDSVKLDNLIVDLYKQAQGMEE